MTISNEHNRAVSGLSIHLNNESIQRKHVKPFWRVLTEPIIFVPDTLIHRRDFNNGSFVRSTVCLKVKTSSPSFCLWKWTYLLHKEKASCKEKECMLVTQYKMFSRTNQSSKA